MNKKIYVIVPNETIDQNACDKDFITEAKRQGTVYEIENFVNAYNSDEINSNNTFIRILEEEEPINDIELWHTSFCVEDVLTAFNEKEIKIWNSLGEKKQRKIIDKNRQDIAKGLESGIMNDWLTVMDTAIDELRKELYKCTTSDIQKNAMTKPCPYCGMKNWAQEVEDNYEIVLWCKCCNLSMDSDGGVIS